MTITIWPDELPKPTRRDYRFQRRDTRSARSAETGPVAFGRRFSNHSQNLALAVKLTRAQKGTFDVFFDVATRGGVKPFFMPDPVTDGWSMLDTSGARVLMADDTPLLLASQLLCLFGAAMPQETIEGLRFIVNFEVEIMP